jgi:nicotinate-nucleotide adenylyltransferase
VLAHDAAAGIGLDEVVLMPTGEAPHKRIEPEPGREVRLELARAAAAGDALLSVSDFEVRSQGPSYSFLTLEALSEERVGDELWFVMGADMAASLESWKRPERVVELARLAIARRPGTPLDEVKAGLERLGASGRADLVTMPELGVSSTEIRRRVRERRSIRYLVPDAVAELIGQQGLYREEVTV